MKSNGKVIATNGEQIAPVKLYHWWPGRTWAGPSPIHPPAEAHWTRTGTRYATIARVYLSGPTGVWLVVGWARCCPKDAPSRRMGRAIALGRLAKELADLNTGWRLEEGDRAQA
jgi:hypothetical protein